MFLDHQSQLSFKRSDLAPVNNNCVLPCHVPGSMEAITYLSLIQFSSNQVYCQAKVMVE